MTQIKTMHAGSLPRPPALHELVVASETGKPYDPKELDTQLKAAVAEVVRKQVAVGLDSINDGEFGKSNFNNYMRERLGGFEERPVTESPTISISDRDRAGGYAGYFQQSGLSAIGVQVRRFFCVDDLSYKGEALLAARHRQLQGRTRSCQGSAGRGDGRAVPAGGRAGLHRALAEQRSLPDDESFLYAIADAMRVEYQGIVDAGFLLQIDDPDLADAWQLHTEMDAPAYQRFAQLRIDALNHALRDIPRDRIRFHMCWGSYHGPHEYDIPLRDIADLILQVKAGSYSIEASNPVHEHEWEVWRGLQLPEGTTLTPGVVGHFSDFIENPELVAQRLVRYASVVGADHLMAGTDCGIGTRIGHPDIAWAKYATLVEGARLASTRI
jgi:5-methyltetrahydropteroyltriglutamate--homocysteine methyltransferase